jgi:hypothetical protein
MRINDIIVENIETNEGVGSALAKGVGGLAKGAASIAGGVHGAWDAAKAGYSAGRSAVSGKSSGNQNKIKANQLRAQADALDGGNSAQSFSGSSVNRSPSTNTSSQGTASGSQTPSTQQVSTSPEPQVKPMDNKPFLTSLQALQGDDVERVRSMLQSRSQMSESEDLDEFNLGAAASSARKSLSSLVKGAKLGYANPQAAKNLSMNPKTSKMTKAGRLIGRAGHGAVKGLKAAGQAAGSAIKAAPGAVAGAAGKVGAVGTQMRQAYQTARGGSMTSQEIAQLIGSMEPADAKQVLNFFNTVHPAQQTTESVGYSRFLGMTL